MANEIQQILPSLAPPGSSLAGSWTLSFSYGGSQTTAPITDMVAADIQSALEALSNIGVGNVSVVYNSGTAAFDITFQNNLGVTNVPQLTANSNQAESLSSIFTDGTDDVPVQYQLTIDATDPKSGTAEFKATAIRLEAV